jgi:hypothetical protein
MPYILKKTSGATLVTVQDASVDNSTSLTFVGRNYSGYGQPVEENFVKLLENFANTTVPAKPVQGQLWFNSSPTVRRLQVCFDGTNFKDISNVPYSDTPPKTPTTGDLWWDSFNQQVKVYDSVTDTWTASQPYGGASSSWDFSRIEDTNANDQSAIRGLFANTTMMLIANPPATTPYFGQYTPASTTGLDTRFPLVRRGINLPNTNPVTGSSADSLTTASGYLLWGTAAESITTKQVQLKESGSTSTHYIPFSLGTSGAQVLCTTSTFYLTPSTNVLNVTAASALYADIAERYEADAVYEPGTVLMHGGAKEVTIANLHATPAVAGIVSTNPAYMMNKDAGTDETHPYIALKGRVPCKIVGPVKKGDILVSSNHPGYACAADLIYSVHPAAIIGKALEEFSEGFGVIEVKV